MSLYSVFLLLVSSLWNPLFVSDAANVVPAFGFGMGMGFGGVGRHYDPNARGRAIEIQRHSPETVKEIPDVYEEISKENEEFIEESAESVEELEVEESPVDVEQNPLVEEVAEEIFESEIPVEDQITDGEIPFEQTVDGEEIPIEKPIMGEYIPNKEEEIPEKIEEAGLIQSPIEVDGMDRLEPDGEIAEIIIFKHPVLKYIPFIYIK